MRTRRSRLLAVILPAVAVAAVAAAGGTAAQASAARTHGTLIAPRGEVLPRHDADTTSLNWAGYDVNGSTIRGVTQSWTVPSAGVLPPGFTASWAGIGGYNSSDLIQAGTSADTVPLSGTQYYAWYEILPAAETQLTDCTGDSACTVSPGDQMTVDIHETSPGQWAIHETDIGRWDFQKTIAYASSHSSAEWIFEAPTFVVQTIPGNVGTAHFGGGNTYTDASGTHTIAAGSPVSIAMGPGLVNEATPSALRADGSSFDVCTYAQTCS